MMGVKGWYWANHRRPAGIERGATLAMYHADGAVVVTNPEVSSVRDSDRITMNRERVLTDAKERALELFRAGYEPPQPRTDIPAPGENILAALRLGVHIMRQGDYITEYEVKLATKIAEVLCGGNVSSATPVSEQYILDLEREGFKSLCGEKRTQERIQYTLRTGKTLRN